MAVSDWKWGTKILDVGGNGKGFALEILSGFGSQKAGVEEVRSSDLLSDASWRARKNSSFDIRLVKACSQSHQSLGSV